MPDPPWAPVVVLYVTIVGDKLVIVNDAVELVVVAAADNVYVYVPLLLDPETNDEIVVPGGIPVPDIPCPTPTIIAPVVIG